MAGYITRRVLIMILLLVLLTFSVFVLFNLLPTDVARLSCGKTCNPETLELIRVRLGLDQSVWVQFWEFFKGIFVGREYNGGTAPIPCPAPCLGYSYTRNELVTTLIAQRLPTTIWLAFGAFVLWMAAGISLGIYSALRRGAWQDKTVMGISLIGYSLPSFFLGLVLIFIVIVRLKWLPFPKYVSPLDDPAGFLQAMILPWIVLAILYAAFYMRLTRSQMLDAMGEDFIRTARAKGLPERTVIGRHALRAGLTPIVTAAGLDLAGLLGGAIITEYLFSLPGIGSLALSSVTSPDQPVIVATVLITAAFIIIANLIVDLLYAAIDPRVRLA